MKTYKGYYIDNIYFHNKEEIDKFLKDQCIKKIKLYNEMFSSGRYDTLGMFALVDLIHEQEMTLHDEYRMEWDEIEEIPYK